MLRLSRTPLLLGLAAGCCLALLPQTGRSQGAAKGAPVQFTTADGVDIKGTFYSGKRDSPTVLMLHALGSNEDSNKKGWQELARSLSGKGYAVLTFDFRGHGDSTNVNAQAFLGDATARALNGSVKGAARGTIEFKDMPKGYYPILANDVAAAKAFLDRRNDAGECNSGAVVVIGADTGAAVGAIWANSEFYRYQVEMAPNFLPGQAFPVQQMKFAKDSEGKNILACVWLSINPVLGVYTLNLSSQLAMAGKTHAVPMAFLYGDKDTDGKRRAEATEKALKAGVKKGKFEYTVAQPIPTPSKEFKGRVLLEVPGVDKAIAEYIDNVNQANPREWLERDFRKTGFVWRAYGQPQPAKFPNEQTMVFHDYRGQPYIAGR